MAQDPSPELLVSNLVSASSAEEVDRSASKLIHFLKNANKENQFTVMNLLVDGLSFDAVLQSSVSIELMDVLLSGEGGLELMQSEKVSSLIITILEKGSMDLQLVVIRNLKRVDSLDIVLIPYLVELIPKETSVSTTTIELIVSLCTKNSNPFFEESITKKMKDILSNDAVKAVRVLTLYSQILCVSDECYEKVESTGILEALIDGLRSSDVLYQLSILQVLSETCEATRGVKFVNNHQILPIITKLLTSPLSLLTTATFTVFQTILKRVESPVDFLRNNPTVLSVVQDLLGNEVSAIQTLGIICQTPGGLELAKHLLNDLVSLIQSDMQVPSLHCFAELLLSSPERTGSNPENYGLFESLYSKIAKDSTEFLRRLIDSSDDESRYAGIHVLQAISGYNWGRKSILGNSQLLSWVLSREKGRGKIDREWKYGLVEAMIWGNGDEILGEFIGQFGAYVAQGPHHVLVSQSNVTVKTEGQ